MGKIDAAGKSLYPNEATRDAALVLQLKDSEHTAAIKQEFERTEEKRGATSETQEIARQVQTAAGRTPSRDRLDCRRRRRAGDRLNGRYFVTSWILIVASKKADGEHEAGAYKIIH